MDPSVCEPLLPAPVMSIVLPGAPVAFVLLSIKIYISHVDVHCKVSWLNSWTVIFVWIAIKPVIYEVMTHKIYSEKIL